MLPATFHNRPAPVLILINLFNVAIWRVTAVLASTVLAMPSVTATPPPGRTAPEPFVECPAPGPAFHPPATPTPPPSNPNDRAIGGQALATTGLALPRGATPPPKLTAASWLVADLDSGTVLGTCGPHEYRTPASVQKLLLAATMLPRLDPTRVAEVTDSDMDFEPGSSAMGVVPGGRYPVESLWLGLLLNSGNDAANVLARLGGGADGRSGGIRAMNAEAHRLGAYQTHAVTPSGLDGPGQFTSAYDLALIARACFARADFRRYSATRVAQIPAQPHQPGFQIANDNKMLDTYPGLIGGKLGYTDLARQTYVGAAQRNTRRLVVTLLGTEAPPRGIFAEASALLDWGFRLPRDATVGHLVAPGPGATPDASSASGRAAVAGSAPTSAPSLRADAQPATATSTLFTALAAVATALPVILLVVLAQRLLTSGAGGGTWWRRRGRRSPGRYFRRRRGGDRS
jgi:D-alanyl-D-alanine carboxypeptidase (penicillin-binding protein 5/6)